VAAALRVFLRSFSKALPEVWELEEAVDFDPGGLDFGAVSRLISALFAAFPAPPPPCLEIPPAVGLDGGLPLLSLMKAAPPSVPLQRIRPPGSGFGVYQNRTIRDKG